MSSSKNLLKEINVKFKTFTGGKLCQDQNFSIGCIFITFII